MTEQEPVAWRRMADAGHYDDHRLEPVGHLWAGEPALDVDGDVFCGEEIVVYDEGSPDEYQAAHIALNDPQDTIARCEAELAILDEHYPQDRGESIPGADCGICWHVGVPGASEPYPCRTVRLLASGYKHRPGYREEDWKP